MKKDSVKNVRRTAVVGFLMWAAHFQCIAADELYEAEIATLKKECTVAHPELKSKIDELVQSFVSINTDFYPPNFLQMIEKKKYGEEKKYSAKQCEAIAEALPKVPVMTLLKQYAQERKETEVRRKAYELEHQNDQE